MINKLPGYKRRDIQKCSGCDQGIMHGQALTFYVCDIQYCMMDPGAIQREHGLEMMMGGHAAIAAALSPDPDIAKQVFSHSLWLCLECSMRLTVAELAEKLANKEDAGLAGPG